MNTFKNMTKCYNCEKEIKKIMESSICLNCGRIYLDEKAVHSALEIIDNYQKTMNDSYLNIAN